MIDHFHYWDPVENTLKRKIHCTHKHKGKQFLFPVHVIKGNSNLLNRSTTYNMGLIQKIECVETKLPVYGSSGLVNCDPVKMRNLVD